MNQSNLWTKEFVCGALTNFFLMTNYYLLVVVITSYTMTKFGSSPSEAGLAFGLFVIGALVARLFSGQLIESMGRRSMLFTGTTLSLVMTALYLVANNIWFLCTVRFLHGLVYGFASVAVVTIVTSIIPKARQGEGIGYYMLSLTLGSAIGPFLAMFIMQHGSYTMIFFACILAAVLGLVSAFFVSVPENRVTGDRVIKTKGFKVTSFFELTVIPISIVCAIMYVTYSSVLSFLTPYTQEINLVDAASFFFLVFSVAILFSRPFTGRLFDSKGENSVMYPAFLAFAVGLILLSQTNLAITLLVAAVFIGLGFGVVQACGMAIAVKASPPERLEYASSTFYVFVDVGVGIGPFILGLFIPSIGYRLMYLSMAVVAFICIFVYRLLHGQKTIQPKINA